MAKKSKAEAAIDSRIDRAYRATCSGVEINIMDISKVFAVGRHAIAQGADDVALANRIVEFVQTIRQN